MWENCLTTDFLTGCFLSVNVLTIRFSILNFLIFPIISFFQLSHFSNYLIFPIISLYYYSTFEVISTLESIKHQYALELSKL